MASFLFDETAVHHCEVVCDEAHGANSNYTNCKINPGHKNFLSVTEFGMEHLPPEHRTENYMGAIQNRIDRTVKITVSSTSKNRPDTYPGCQMPYPFTDYRGDNYFSRCGTGFLSPVVTLKEKPCPCPDCKRSDQQKTEYWEFFVSTATHVVFDDIEAESVVVDLFYDTEDKHGVKNLYGVNVFNTHDSYSTDACDVNCITHEKELAQKLYNIFNSWYCDYELFEDHGILISHPHGVCKKISIGSFHQHHFIISTGPDATPIPLCKNATVYIPPNDATEEDTWLYERLKHKQATAHQIKPTDKRHSEADIVAKPQDQTTHRSLYDFLDPTHLKDVFLMNDCADIVFPFCTEIMSTSYNSVDLPPGWYTFLSDTHCCSPDGIRVDVMKGTMFFYEIPNFESLKYVPMYPSYITYDMASCPGSSGAKVGRWCHFGSIGEGKNRSGFWKFDRF